jgi:hypothetical protein
MELEELKSIWRSGDTEFQPKDEREIALMLKRRSVSIIDKLERNVWFELILTLVIGMALVVYALTLPSGAIKWVSICLLTVYCVTTFTYVKKIRLLRSFNPVEKNLRASLTALIETLSGYITFYHRSYTILYPLFFCLMLLFIGIERGAASFFDNLVKPVTIISLLFVAGVYYLTSTWFAKWYLKKLYGNHVEKLKSLLNDIQG